MSQTLITKIALINFDVNRTVKDGGEGKLKLGSYFFQNASQDWKKKNMIEATMPTKTKCQNLFLLSDRKKTNEHRWSYNLVPKSDGKLKTRFQKLQLLNN